MGSNRHRERNIRAALDLLRQTFGGGMLVSPVFESASVAGSAVAADSAGDAYFNLVLAVETDLAVRELKQLLRGIEAQCGRVRGAPKEAGCPLDIDLLLYGDVAGVVDGVLLPHPDVLSRAYVLRPLSLLAPQSRHPQLQQTFAQLWAERASSAMALREVDASFLD